MYKVTAATRGAASVVIQGKADPNAHISGGKLTEYVNEVPTFEFCIYPNNPGYSTLENMLTTVTVYDRKAGEDTFKGRVYSISDVMTADGVVCKNVSCEGELAYLNDTIQPSLSYGSGVMLGAAVNAILNTHNTRVGDDARRIQFYGGGNVGLPEAFAEDYISSFDAVKELCEMCGWEFRIVYANGVRYLELAKQFGERSGTEIALSVNLKALQRDTAVKDIVTRYYALGVNEAGGYFDLKASSVHSEYLTNSALEAKYGIIEAAKIYTDITVKDSQGIPAGAARLYRAAKRDYGQMVGMLTSFSLDAVDLALINGSYESLKMYDTYRVITKLQGIDDEVRITGRTLMLDNPQNPTLTFGQKQTTLTSMLAKG